MARAVRRGASLLMLVRFLPDALVTRPPRKGPACPRAAVSGERLGMKARYSGLDYPRLPPRTMAALEMLSAVLAALAAISAFTYIALFLFDRYCPEQDLKVRVRAARGSCSSTRGFC